MKVLKSISLYFIYPLAMFFLGFFTHVAYVDFFYPNKMNNESEKRYPVEIEEITEVSDTGDNITTCDTSYVIIEYNLEDDEKTSSTGSLPEMYLGMTREKLEEALLDYELNPTLEDQEKGFLSLQLKNFSTNQVVVQKNYKPIIKTTGYYLMVQDGKIVVMEEDQQTVYLTTEIYAEDLSDGLKQELIMGKFINDIDELYGFLESYTS